MARNAEPVAATPAYRSALLALALTGAAGIVLVGVLGAVNMARAPVSQEVGARPVGTFAAFALDAETNVAAAFAALLSLAAAVAALVAAALRPVSVPRWAFVILALVFGYLALDEWLALHERLPNPFGASRRLYFIPAALVAFAAWLAVLRGLRRRLTRTLWLVAPAAWVLSQVLAEVAWAHDRPVALYKPITVAEEILELVGSYLFGLTLLLVLLRVLESRFGQAAGARG